MTRVALGTRAIATRQAPVASRPRSVRSVASDAKNVKVLARAVNINNDGGASFLVPEVFTNGPDRLSLFISRGVGERMKIVLHKKMECGVRTELKTNCQIPKILVSLYRNMVHFGYGEIARAGLVGPPIRFERMTSALQEQHSTTELRGRGDLIYRLSQRASIPVFRFSAIKSGTFLTIQFSVFVKHSKGRSS